MTKDAFIVKSVKAPSASLFLFINITVTNSRGETWLPNMHNTFRPSKNANVN